MRPALDLFCRSAWTRFFGGAANGASRWRDGSMREIRAELSDLDERTLADIGIGSDVALPAERGPSGG